LRFESSCGQGFTLVELLVVIAVIGILASMLLPAFSTSKERARMAQCLSNLRQVSLGMRMYADEDNGLFPLSGDEIPWDMIDNRTHRVGWMQQILDQVANKDVFRCPSDRRSLYSYFNGARAAYVINHSFAPVDSKRIQFHSAFVLSGDTRWYEGRNTIADADKDDDTYNCVGGPGNGTPYRDWKMHNRGQNLLFEDGHARWYRGYVTNEMTFRYESMHGWK
jgi:prepilin-type N-terminal cleavage/methylation domain-containing protein